MVSSQPQLITKLTTLLAERLWFLYKQLANTLVSNPLGKMFDALWIQLEKNRVRISPQESYTFEFGPKELLTMVGLPLKEGDIHLKELFQNKKVRVVENKIFAADVEEIFKQAEYYRKMEKIERSRREGSKQF